MSGAGMTSCCVSSRNDGTAITTRISAGIMVQAISMGPLWVSCEGIGFARSLKRMTTMASRARTKTEMPMVAGKRKAL